MLISSVNSWLKVFMESFLDLDGLIGDFGICSFLPFFLFMG